MDCDAAREFIEELLDGRLPAADEAALREHASTCPECSAALGASDAFAGQLAASFRAAREAAPDNLTKRVMRAVAGDGFTGRPVRLTLVAAVPPYFSIERTFGFSFFKKQPYNRPLIPNFKCIEI